MATRNLTADEIQSCLTGCCQVRKTAEGLMPLRFHEGALDYYGVNDTFRPRATCPAGITLTLRTNSPWIEIDVATSTGSRDYGYADLWSNGRFTGTLGISENGGTIAGRMDTAWTSPGDPQERALTLYLPHSRTTVIRSVSVAEGASLSHAPSRPVLLAFGDSITQGMDSRHPSLTYIATAARRCGMALHNGAVGGHYFDATSLPEAPAAGPEIIVVAYGVNDWAGGRPVEAAEPFLARVRELYPEVPALVLSPLWHKRGDTSDAPADWMLLSDYRARLITIVNSFHKMTAVDGISLLPPHSGLLPDGLHPDSAGHIVCGETLAREIRDSEDGK